MEWLRDFIDWWTPATVSATAAVIAATVAITTGITGIRTLRQNREDSERRSRPMVSAELRTVPYVHGAQTLVIRNHGPAIARNVKVEFDPPLPESPNDQGRDFARFIRARYAHPVPALVPGIELDNTWYALDFDQPATNLPNQCTVTITIDNPSRPSRPYVDRFELDVDLLVHRSYMTSPAAPEERLQQIAKHLDSIAKTLKGWKAWWPTRADVERRGAAGEEKRAGRRGRLPRLFLRR